MTSHTEFSPRRALGTFPSEREQYGVNGPGPEPLSRTDQNGAAFLFPHRLRVQFRVILPGPQPAQGLVLAYLFEAIDTDLQENGWLARLQAAVLASTYLSHERGYIPKQWKSALRVSNCQQEDVALKVMSELVQIYVNCRFFEALPSFTKESPEFTGVSPEAARSAIDQLCRAGLITVKSMVTADVSRHTVLLRPTSKALIALLKNQS
jgi:hypothetical protein